MKIAEVKVAKTTCETTLLVPIPKGIIGATVSIEYMDSAWDGLQKTVVFRSSVTKDVLASGNEVVIPAEVVSRAGKNLYMGVYGVDVANNVVIPTIWTNLDMIHSAADPSGDSSSDPSLPVWAQLQGMIGNLDDLDTAAKNNLVAAVNEALKKGGGSVDEAEIQRIVDEYLAANPPTVTETDPTVPEWAKQPEKPTYTAAEVGALPDTYTIPTATDTTLGGVKPVTATDAMTQPVGVDADGRLMTKPGSGGSGIAVTGATVGQTIRVAAVDNSGIPTAWEPVDFPSGSGVTDVQINASSVVTDGVATIPLANGSDVYGAVRQGSSSYYCGIEIKNGNLSCSFQNQSNGEEWLVMRVRNQNYFIPFLAKGFDLMVKHAMCDTGTATSGYAKPLIWSDAERISALLRLGCSVDDNGFVKWTAQEVAE